MSPDILNGIVDEFRMASTGWYAALFPYAQKLFFSLLVIDLVLLAAQWLTERDDGGKLMSSLLWRMLGAGFAYTLLLYAHTWIPAVVETFLTAGARAAHIETLNPSAILGAGASVAALLIGKLGMTSFFIAPAALVVTVPIALLTFLAFLAVACYLAATLVESYILIGGGVFLLGFAGSRFVSFISERYLSWVASVCASLFVQSLIMGVGVGLVQRWVQDFALQPLDDPKAEVMR